MDTFYLDKMGCLHIWRGEILPRGVCVVDPPPCDVFLRALADIDAVVEQMDSADRADLYVGWTVYAEVDWRVYNG